MTYGRISWNPICPHHFESAWSVFAKILAVNYIRPGELVSLISKSDIDDPRTIGYMNSSWIDFDKFGKALGVDPRRLRMCFLDQLGLVTKDSRSSAIRHCPVCLGNGVHLVFFHLSLLDECPIHNVPLTEPCPSCSAVVSEKGLSRHVLRVDGLPESECDEVYQSSCGHILFDPERYAWSYWYLSRQDERNLILQMLPLLRWFEGLKALSDNKGIMLDGLSDRHINAGNRADLSNRLAIAERLTTPFPCRTYLDRVQRTWTVCVSGECEVDASPDWFGLYRIVRRRIYKRLVRVHRRCWVQVMNMSDLDAKSLDSLSICSLSLAYASWRMGMEGYSNIDGLARKQTIREIHRKPDLVFSDREIHNPADVLIWLMTSFYSIWEKIEELTPRQCVYIDRMDNSSSYSSFDCISRSCREIDGNRYLWTIYPDPDALLSRSNERCFRRRIRREDMVNVRLLGELSNWAWTGQFGEYGHRDCLFRIKKRNGNQFERSYIFIMV